MDAVVVTGGFRNGRAAPRAVSTDFAALKGAKRYAEEKGRNLKECYEAWIPEPSLDGRPDVKGVVRMTEADGITLRVMAGRTSLGRRLAMVAGVDMVVTIAGKTHTEIVVEHALEIGIPVLPIPDAGGDSADLLKAYKPKIAAAFDPGALEECLTRVSATINDNPRSAALTVVDLIRTAKVGKCLVLMPYDDDHNTRYSSTIEPAVAKHMISINLARLPSSEAIYTSFADNVRSASAIIADVTQLNPNVMYEIGYAHGSGATPLLYTRDAARLQDLPVYLKTLNIRLADETTRSRSSSTNIWARREGQAAELAGTVTDRGRGVFVASPPPRAGLRDQRAPR